MSEQVVTSCTTIVIRGNGRNLLNPSVMSRLEASLRAADADESVSGIILTGAGDVFCGGLDVEALQDGADPLEFAGALVSLLKLFPVLATPVVALVNGDAVASGASLVAVCDFAVAVPTSRIGTYEVSVGIWPMIAQVPLIKRLGARVAMENIASGEPFSAARAREVGLINRVVEAGEIEDAAVGWLTDATRAGSAVRGGRPAAYLLEELPYDEALDRSLQLFRAMF